MAWYKNQFISIVKKIDFSYCLNSKIIKYGRLYGDYRLAFGYY